MNQRFVYTTFGVPDPYTDPYRALRREGTHNTPTYQLWEYTAQHQAASQEEQVENAAPSRLAPFVTLPVPRPNCDAIHASKAAAARLNNNSQAARFVNDDDKLNLLRPPRGTPSYHLLSGWALTDEEATRLATISTSLPLRLVPMREEFDRVGLNLDELLVRAGILAFAPRRSDLERFLRRFHPLMRLVRVRQRSDQVGQYEAIISVHVDHVTAYRPVYAGFAGDTDAATQTRRGRRSSNVDQGFTTTDELELIDSEKALALVAHQVAVSRRIAIHAEPHPSGRDPHWLHRLLIATPTGHLYAIQVAKLGYDAVRVALGSSLRDPRCGKTFYDAPRSIELLENCLQLEMDGNVDLGAAYATLLKMQRLIPSRVFAPSDEGELATKQALQRKDKWKSTKTPTYDPLCVSPLLVPLVNLYRNYAVPFVPAPLSSLQMPVRGAASVRPIDLGSMLLAHELLERDLEHTASEITKNMALDPVRSEFIPLGSKYAVK